MFIKELIDRLSGRERLILGIGCGLIAAALLFQVIVVSSPKREFHRLQKQEWLLRERVKALETESAAKDRSLRDWSATLKDLETLRTNLLYSRNSALFQVRMDLEKLLQSSGLFMPDVTYEYDTLPDSKLGLIRLVFALTTDYLRLKRFIHAAENFPRFLIVEKIDFMDIDSESGRLRLRLHVAGCYE